MSTLEFNKGNQNYENMLDKQFDASMISQMAVLAMRGYMFDPVEKKMTNEYKAHQLNEEGVMQEVTVIRRPLLNEKGIQEISQAISLRVYNANASGNLEGNDIETMRHSIKEIVWTSLAYNLREYEIEDVTKVYKIMADIDDPIMVFFSKARQGWFSNLLTKIIGRKEQVNYNMETPQTKKGGSII